ncbi:RagB/SusD family nutrient uptake outer membrane protein [Aquimarina longa]|uniref:RagB/SusD family nutrient uptake outer membrane protein n=1 Tax=Aquimarina longa TaxID=1080221 RepID=UPI0007814FC1|nr:RagB/SusD family nutrient uptake outer membrane protein [Aquimarina longa]
MKKYILLLAVMTILSCEDTLEQRFSDSVDAREAITDINSLKLATNGAYALLANPAHYNRSFVLFPEIMSDNAFIDAFDNTGRYLDFDNYTLTANNVRVNETWNMMSRIITTTSIVIREANKVSFPETVTEDVDQYIGEMYALRGLAFHNFQLLYAQPYNFTTDASHLGVPIPDFELLGNGANIQELARSTTANVYKQITNDLLEAINLMRVGTNPAKMDRNAAKALLARVYLHMQNWKEARDMAAAVIDNSGKKLLTREAYLASWAEDSNVETLFTISNKETDSTRKSSIGYFYLTYRDAFATDNFKDILSDTDIRKELYPTKDVVNLVKKFPRTVTKDDNIQVLRLSEMYLIKAEAHAQLNETVDAQQALDVIIQRADSNTIPPSTETGQALLDKILVERRKELAYEGFRLFDLTRYGITFNKFKQDTAPISIVAPSNKTILPIPIKEINVNPNIANQQNPGY